MVEFGDYLFIEEDYKTVILADNFHTLPAKYEHLRKWYNIIGRASKHSILIGAKMKPELTIVLQKKIIRKKIEERNRERSVATKPLTYFNTDIQ